MAASPTVASLLKCIRQGITMRKVMLTFGLLAGIASATVAPAEAAGYAYWGPHGGGYGHWYGHGRPLGYGGYRGSGAYRPYGYGGAAVGAAAGLAVGAAVGAAAASRPAYARPTVVYAPPPVVYVPRGYYYGY